MKTALTVVLTSLCMAATTMGQSPSVVDTCKADQQKMESVIGQTNPQPPLAQFMVLIHFLETIKDDPADCVSTTVTDRITQAERQIIGLKVGGQTFAPDWVFHCNEIDKRSAWCSGGELDTSAQLPEAGFGTRLSHSPAHARTAQLLIQDGYPCKVIGIYGSSSTALQDGKPPFLLANDPTDIEIGKLPAKYPVLMVTLTCKDKLRYRKAVWHLY